jgi:hypothetical protein
MKRCILIAALLLAREASANTYRQDTTPSTCNVGDVWVHTAAFKRIYECLATNTWTWNQAFTVPAGIIVLSLTTCPVGFTEETSLNGKFVLGTLNANGNVTGTGGVDSVTPTGTVAAPVISWPAGVPTYTGTPFSGVINHTHTVTSVGSSASGGATNLTGASDTSSTTATAANPAGGVASITPAGTVAWPAGVPTNTAPAFTGASQENRPAFVRVIFCKAN